MASEFWQRQRGELSSFFQKLELGLRPLSQAFLDLAEKTVASYPQLKGVVETMNLGKLFGGKETYPLEANVQASLNTLKAAQARRHAESHRHHLWLLAASSGALAVAAFYGYLQESRILDNAGVSALDNQPKSTEAAPAGIVDSLAPTPTPDLPTETPLPPSATFIPVTETAIPELTASPPATLSPEEARLAEIERLAAEFKIPAHREDFVVDASWVPLTDRISPGNSRAIDIASHAGFNPFIVGEPVVGKAPGGEDMVEVIGVYTTPHGNDWVRIVFGPGTPIIDGQRRKIAGSLETIKEIVDYVNEVRARNGQLGVAYPNSAVFGALSSTGVFTHAWCTAPKQRSCGWMFDVYVRGHESELRNFLPDWGSGNRITLPAFYVIEGGDRVGYFFTPSFTPTFTPTEK